MNDLEVKVTDFIEKILQSKKSYYENLERLLSTENAKLQTVLENLKAIVKFKQKFYKNTYISIQWSKC